MGVVVVQVWPVALWRVSPLLLTFGVWGYGFEPPLGSAAWIPDPAFCLGLGGPLAERAPWCLVVLGVPVTCDFSTASPVSVR